MIFPISLRALCNVVHPPQVYGFCALAPKYFAPVRLVSLKMYSYMSPFLNLYIQVPWPGFPLPTLNPAQAHPLGLHT